MDKSKEELGYETEAEKMYIWINRRSYGEGIR